MLSISYSDHFLSDVHPSICSLGGCPSVRPSVITFKRLFLWSRWANFTHSYGASWGRGNERLLKWSRSVDQDGHHAHIWLKPLKIFFSRTEDALVLTLCIEDRRSTKVAKMIIVRWRLTFLRQGQVCFPMTLYGPHTFYGKNIENFKWLLLWSHWANVAKIPCGASFGWGNEKLLNCWGPLT